MASCPRAGKHPEVPRRELGKGPLSPCHAGRQGLRVLISQDQNSQFFIFLCKYTFKTLNRVLREAAKLLQKTAANICGELLCAKHRPSTCPLTSFSQQPQEGGRRREDGLHRVEREVGAQPGRKLPGVTSQRWSGHSKPVSHVVGSHAE